jgi:hypothetical protein
MKNIIIIKVDFCKTFGTNNIINTIINTSISYLMIWGGLQRQMGDQLEVQGFKPW